MDPVTTNCRFCDDEFSYEPVRKKAAFADRALFKSKRLSVRNVCDECRIDSKRRDRCKRYGPGAKDGPPISQEKREADKLASRHYIAGGQIMFAERSPDAVRTLHMLGADGECTHGRLAGDPCPSPLVEFTSAKLKGTIIQNWPHEEPCGCWNE